MQLLKLSLDDPNHFVILWGMIRYRSKYIFRENARGLGLRRMLVPLLLLGLCGILGFQAWVGERGLKSLLEMRQIGQAKQTEIEQIIAGNRLMMDRVKRLQLGSLDLDYLDERARSELGMVHPDDKILTVEPSR